MANIVINSGFVLPDVDGIDARNPMIGWQNMLADEDSLLSVTTEAADEPLTNLQNGATYLAWRATTTAQQVVSVDLGVPRRVDYFGVGSHNLGTIGSSVLLQYSDDGEAWADASPLYAPDTANGVVFTRFTARTVRYWRFIFSASATPVVVRLAVLYLGELLILQRRIYIGHAPYTFGRKTTLSQGRSENGQFLGRMVRQEFLEHTIEQKNITPEWARSKLLPFLDAARTEPFFWAWRPSQYPGECAFGWLMDDPTTTNSGPHKYMTTSLKIQSIP